MNLRMTITALVAVLAACVASAQGPQVAPNEVRLCENKSFLGYCYSAFLEEGMRQRLVPNLPPAIAKKVASVLVGDQVVATGWEDADYCGRSRNFDHNDSHVPSSPSKTSWSNPYAGDISSLIVYLRKLPPPLLTGLNGVTLYEMGYGEACFFPLPQDSSRTEARFPNLPQNINDEAELLYTLGHVETELYEHAEFKGKHIKFPGSWSPYHLIHLDTYGFDDFVSSLIIRRPGSSQVDRLEEPPPAPDGRAGVTQHHPPPPAAATPALAVIPGQIVPPGSPSLALQYDSDRPGHDYHNQDLPQARPELCRDLCAQDPRCEAFTYVPPGIQGSKARCWLKDMASRPQHAKGLVSGVKHDLPPQ